MQHPSDNLPENIKCKTDYEVVYVERYVHIKSLEASHGSQIHIISENNFRTYIIFGVNDHYFM